MAIAQEFDKSVNTGNISDESRGMPFGEMIRDYDVEPGTIWRFGLPNYARVNQAYFRHRSKVHKEGSLESVVSKIVKNWEVESHHIANPKQWKTMDSPSFQIAVNGGVPASAQLMADVGPYNLLMGESPMYSSAANTYESSNLLWGKTFPEGFAWEVLEVLSGPPTVTFQWRHFGIFSGAFVDKNGVSHKGNGELVEMKGLCIAKVTDDLKIQTLDVYYNPDDLIRPLLENSSPEEKILQPEDAAMTANAPNCSKDGCSMM